MRTGPLASRDDPLNSSDIAVDVTCRTRACVTTASRPNERCESKNGALDHPAKRNLALISASEDTAVKSALEVLVKVNLNDISRHSDVSHREAFIV